MNKYRTQSLFHYTKSIDNIVGILSARCLYPNYCSEDLSTKKYPNKIIGIPQICFCDIPVSVAETFTENYGRYAIGFKKQWGIQYGCNPVQYINNEDIIDGALFYHKMWKAYNEYYNKNNHTFGEKVLHIWQQSELHTAKTHMFGFMKKYNGEWKGEMYCNYDENEWRYIVEEGTHNIDWMWENGEYEEWRGCIYSKKPAPTEAMKTMGLKFAIEDINHIILNKDEEISSFIDKIQQQIDCGIIVLNNSEHAQLMSKITSFERIHNDY